MCGRGRPSSPSGGGWIAPEVTSRVSIDDTTGAATRDLLVMGTTTYAATARFAVVSDLAVDPVRSLCFAYAGERGPPFTSAHGADVGWAGLASSPMTQTPASRRTGRPYKSG